MNAVVYAMHEPSRYDRGRNKMVKLDLGLARTFGNLHVVFPGVDRPPNISEALPRLKEEMAKFRPCDRLLIVGDMDLFAFAAVLAAKATAGKLTLLKWHNRDRAYYEVTAPEGLL